MTGRWNNTAPGRTRIKICGLRDESMVRAAVDAGADAVGFVLASNSPRSIDVDEAIHLASMLPDHVTPIGVVVDADDNLLNHWAPRWIQLHGNETPEIAETYNGPVIRALSFDPEAITGWDGARCIERLLIDAATPGSGDRFDHDAFALLPRTETPIIIAGGLDPGSIEDVIRTLHPWGVDVSSGVETSLGVKDARLIQDFCQAAADADCS